MADPIQVERYFQEVMIHFESSLSVRHRYQLFRDFMENLEGSFRRYESYIVQIVDLLPEFAGPLTWSGIDPEEIEMDMALLDELEKSLTLSNKSENFERIQNHLGEICLLLYAFLNEKTGVDHHLKKLFGITGLNRSDLTADSQILNLLEEKLSKELNKKEETIDEILDRLNRIVRQIKEVQMSEKWRALVPVAEIYEKGNAEKQEYGRLRKIFVDRYYETSKHDELIWNTNIFGVSNPTLTNKKKPLEAARHLFELTSTSKTKSFYRGGISFELPSAIHDGESANLAIAALWYTRLLEASNQRERYYINSRTVITGDVDRDGNVSPVDYEAIKLKIRAAFFSWANLMIVPSEQRNLFESELRKLVEKYPNRNLNLIGVSHLRELFFDRRATLLNKESRLKFYYKMVKSHKYRLISISVVIILLSIIGWLIFGQ